MPAETGRSLGNTFSVGWENVNDALELMSELVKVLMRILVRALMKKLVRIMRISINFRRI